MSWRIHLTNQAIQNLNILPAKAPVLVVWLRNNRVHHYDFESGTLLAEQNLPYAPQPNSETWQEYTSNLMDPDKKLFLPHARSNGLEVFTTHDGTVRLYRNEEKQLFFQMGEIETPLELPDVQGIVALSFDPDKGALALLDQDLKLHIYQNQTPSGIFDLSLQMNPDAPASLAIAHGGERIFASDGHQLVMTDLSGAVQKTQQMHYIISRLAVSPNGSMLVTSDMESGVLRVYRGESLSLTHQRFAIDLVLSANQVQLMADLPPTGTAVSALIASTKGNFAFSMSGVVCVTGVDEMDMIPRPTAPS